MRTFTLPSFTAPNSSSATSCVESFTCVLHVSPKGKRGGTRVFACIGRVAQGQCGGRHACVGRVPPSTCVLGLPPMGSVGVACVCWACLKIGREGACLKRPTVILVTNCHFSGDTHTEDRHRGLKELTTSVRAYAPARYSKPQPRAPSPDPRLKPGPVFVASGGVTIKKIVRMLNVAPLAPKNQQPKQ